MRIKNFLYRIDPLVFIVINLKKLVKKENRRMLRNIVAYVAADQKKSKLAVTLDLWGKCAASNAIFYDYTYLYFYQKSYDEVRKYFTYGKSAKMLKPLKTKAAAAVLDNKPLFLETFRDFTRRDFLSLGEGTDCGGLEGFIKKHPVFIAKPANLNGGRGIELIDSADFASAGELLEYLKAKRLSLLEERKINHRELAKFSDISLNTMRIICVRQPEKVKIICSFIRFNIAGGIADNMSAGGCACPIDPATGRLVLGMTNSRELDNRYIRMHPKGFLFEEQIIPCWEQVVRMAEEATLFLDGVNFVAWDIAVTDDGPLIIEGNNEPGYHYQITTGVPVGKDIERAYRYALKQGKAR